LGWCCSYYYFEFIVIANRPFYSSAILWRTLLLIYPDPEPKACHVHRKAANVVYSGASVINDDNDDADDDDDDDDDMLQILLCMICPLLIPFLITFDRSTGMPLFQNRVAPMSKKEANKQEKLIFRTRRHLHRMCGWFSCCRILVLLLYTGRHFYKAPVVKFCCYTVTLHGTCTQT